jgi:thiol:disulfide interchange protein
MLLDRDEFLVTFDPAKTTEARLIAVVKKSGYTAQVVSERNKAAELTAKLETLPTGFALLDESLAKAKAENKLLVLDFGAEWCLPCRRMEKTTLVDRRVVELLKQVVFVRLDTDQHTEIAQQLGVVGLPDIRFVAPDGLMLRQLRGFQEAESFAAALEQTIRQITTK